MKKLSKFIYSIFAFAIIACMAIFNPAINFADAWQAGDTLPDNFLSISTSKIDADVEVGEKPVIPVPDIKAKGAVEKFIIVKDRTQVKYTYNCQTGETFNQKGDKVTDYFTLLDNSRAEVTIPTSDGTNDAAIASAIASVKFVEVANAYKGTYTAQYKVTKGNKTYYSNEKKIVVKGSVYSWEFNQENTTKNIIPSITSLKDINGNTAKYQLPLPKILNNEDNSIYETFDVDDVNAEEVVAGVKQKSIKVFDGGVDITSEVLTVEDGKVWFTPILDEHEESDTYVIKYFSPISAFPDETFEIKVDSTYEPKAELEVTHDSISNVQVGAVTTFPTANVTDKTHNKSTVKDEFDVNVKITITDEDGNEVPSAPTDNQYTYTFTKDGNYKITYTVKDAYGNPASSKTTSIYVSDKKPHIISYANTYDTTATNWTENVETNVDYLVPNEVGYNGFYVPAIYAEDYVTAYENLKFTRKLVMVVDGEEEEVSFNIDKAEDNAAYVEIEGETQFNKVIKFEFPTTAQDPEERLEEIKEKYAGKTFKLVYTVEDENGKTAKIEKHTIKIADVPALANNVDKNLQISFATINENIDPQAELTFTTATGREDPADSNLTVDERIEIKTYWYYGEKALIETELQTYIDALSASDEEYEEKYGYDFAGFMDRTGVEALNLTELKSVSGKTTLSLTNYEDQAVATVFAVAINDQGQFVIKAQELGINDTSETVAPEVVVVEDTYSTQLNGVTKFNQNVKVTLPSVTFKDAIDKDLALSVTCYVDTPDQSVEVVPETWLKEATGECGIGVAKLTTTYAGTYYVVYTASDDAGNTTSYVSTFEVAKTEKGYIDVENGANISKLVEEKVKINYSLKGEGTYDNVDFDVDWGENKPSATDGNGGYIFNKAGTYTATIKVIYYMNGVKIEDTPSVPVTITITEPTMEWEDNVDSILTNDTADINEEIELPVISAIENGTPVTADPKVTYTNKDGKVTDVTLTTKANSYTFKAEKDGVYKVTYTATTKYNSESKSFTITCGDYYEPTIIIAGNKLEGSKLTYQGKDIEVSATFKTVSDEDADLGKYTLTVVGKSDGKEIFNYDIAVELKDKDANGETKYFAYKTYTLDVTGDNVSDSGSNWKIKGVGDYELKLTVTDANGNKNTKSIKFSVESKTEPKSVSDNVVGIVLIVVSVVILGGVILFFALAGKRNKSKRNTSKNK